MTYRAMGLGAGFFASAAQPQIASFDYLQPNGPGRNALYGIASDTVKILLSGKAGGVGVNWLQPHQEIAAIFAGRGDEANLIGALYVTTLIAKERAKPASARQPYNLLAMSVPYDLEKIFLNGGNPAECQVNFDHTFSDYQQLNGAMQVPATMSPTGWCARNPYLLDKCNVGSFCAATTAANGQTTVTSAAAPTTDTRPVVRVTSPAPAPPPTHAQIEASVQTKMGASGQTYEAVSALADQSQLKMYLDTLAISRVLLTRALALPSSVTDEQVWAALAARGISPSEAVDWFLGCNADVDCFRTQMNVALGEADVRRDDGRAKLVAGALVAGAVAFTFFVFRGR